MHYSIVARLRAFKQRLHKAQAGLVFFSRGLDVAGFSDLVRMVNLAILVLFLVAILLELAIRVLCRLAKQIGTTLLRAFVQLWEQVYITFRSVLVAMLTKALFWKSNISGQPEHYDCD